MRSDGRDKIDIARRAAVYGGPATWAPSGTLIAFSGEKKEERHPGIYLIRPNAKGLKRLTSPRWEAQYPAWSPDGRKIAFVYVVNGGFNVYVMNADGGHVTQLTHGGFDNWPVWSPDGKQIAFNRRDSIWIMTADGRQERRLRTSIPGGAPLNWSPKKWLIFACNRPGGIGICAQGPSARTTTRLLGGRDGGFPAWRP